MNYEQWCSLLAVPKETSVNIFHVPPGKTNKTKFKLKLTQTAQQNLAHLNSTLGKGQIEQGLFMPTINNRFLKVRGNGTPMWKYHYRGGAFDGVEVQNHNHKHSSETQSGGLFTQSVTNPFTTNNLKKMIVDDQQLLSGLVVLNGRDHNNGQASIFGFERGRKLGDVMKEINSHLHLGVDLSFHGLYLYNKKEEGRFLSNSNTLAEEGFGDIEIVELRHLPIYQFVDNSQQPPQTFNFYDDNITIAQLTKELAQGVQALSSVSSLTSILPTLRSKFASSTSSSPSPSPSPSSTTTPNSSSLRIVYLPHGEQSLEQNWLVPSSTLKSCQIGRGSTLLLCEYDGNKTPPPSTSSTTTTTSSSSPPSSPSSSPSSPSMPKASSFSLSSVSRLSSTSSSHSSFSSLPSSMSLPPSPPSSPRLPTAARTFFRSVYVAQSPFHTHSNWRNLAEYPLMEAEQIVTSLHNVTQVLDTRQTDKKDKEKKEKEKKEKKRTRKKKELGDVHLTNANLIFCVFSPSFTYYTDYYVTPLQEIARIEPSPSQSSKGIDIYCKHMKSFQLILPSKDTSQPSSSSQSPSSRTAVIQTLEGLAFGHILGSFAFQRKKYFMDCDYGWDLFQGFEYEMARQNISERNWRVTYINAGYQECPTYPNKLIVPATVSDEELKEVFSYRSKGRVPALTYYHLNGAAMTRSAQPLPGMTYKTCAMDERLLEAIRTSNDEGLRPSTSHPPLYIFDARPKMNALGNQAAGAGFELTGTGTGYSSCILEFMNIENIHVIRGCHQSMQSVMEGHLNDSNFNCLVHLTGWLTQVRLVLAAAARVAEVMENEGASVLVHCSDGWDRTAQICALAQLMLSPQSRTTQGLQILIEKDWLSFGHKFQTRHGHADKNDKDDQRAPIFLQFLDCVWQLTQQFPCSFEFNSQFLLDIVDASYNCQTGTFLYNNELERKDGELKRTSVSLWTLMARTPEKYKNVFYFPENFTRIPHFAPHSIKLWKDYFMRDRSQKDELGMTPALRYMQIDQQLQAKTAEYESLLLQMKELEEKLKEKENNEK